MNTRIALATVARATTRRLAVAVLCIGGLLTGPAAAAPPLFDAHLHYNDEHARRYPPAQILRTLRENGVVRAVVTARPPEQALALYRQDPQRIIPLLGVYRDLAEKQTWMQDDGLPGRVEQALSDGPWRGVGELHIFAGQRRSPVFLRIVELATAHDLPLLMHCDPAVIDALFEHAPAATVVWAHAGAYPYPALLRDYLQRYPRLYIDLSVRDDRIAPDGELDADWELLLLEHPQRFLVGVDTFRTERWARFGEVAAIMRAWLAQLPTDVARLIARDNGERVFAPSRAP